MDPSREQRASWFLPWTLGLGLHRDLFDPPQKPNENNPQDRNHNPVIYPDQGGERDFSERPPVEEVAFDQGIDLGLALFFFDVNTYFLKGFGRFLANLVHLFRGLMLHLLHLCPEVFDLGIEIGLTASPVEGENRQNEGNDRDNQGEGRAKTPSNNFFFVAHVNTSSKAF
jgi:hypothetical protein